MLKSLLHCILAQTLQMSWGGLSRWPFIIRFWAFLCSPVNCAKQVLSKCLLKERISPATTSLSSACQYALTFKAQMHAHSQRRLFHFPSARRHCFSLFPSADLTCVLYPIKDHCRCFQQHHPPPPNSSARANTLTFTSFPRDLTYRYSLHVSFTLYLKKSIWIPTVKSLYPTFMK